jgi:hypothetical protein
VGHKPPETAWLGAPKAAEGCQGLPTTGYHSLHSQDLGPVPVVPGGGVIPTLSIVTSTVSRSVNSSGSLYPVPGQSMGINLPSWGPNHPQKALVPVIGKYGLLLLAKNSISIKK